MPLLTNSKIKKNVNNCLLLKCSQFCSLVCKFPWHIYSICSILTSSLQISFRIFIVRAEIAFVGFHWKLFLFIPNIYRSRFFLQDVMKNIQARLHIGILTGNIFICLFTEVHHCIVHNSFIGHGKKICLLSHIIYAFCKVWWYLKNLFPPIVHKIVALSLSVYITLK